MHRFTTNVLLSLLNLNLNVLEQDTYNKYVMYQ